jgi:hypothetical protein
VVRSTRVVGAGGAKGGLGYNAGVDRELLKGGRISRGPISVVGGVI